MVFAVIYLRRESEDLDRTWLLILGMTGVTVLFWFVGGGIALRYFVLFVGVMSCMYALWDIVGASRPTPLLWTPH